MTKQIHQDPEFLNKLPSYARPYIDKCIQDILGNLPTVASLLYRISPPSTAETSSIKSNTEGVMSCFIAISHISNSRELMEHIGETFKQITEESKLDLSRLDPKSIFQAASENETRITALIDHLLNSLPTESNTQFGFDYDHTKIESHLNYENISSALSILMLISISNLKTLEDNLFETQTKLEEAIGVLNIQLQVVAFWHDLYLACVRQKEYIDPGIRKIREGVNAKRKAQSNRDKKYKTFITWVIEHPNSGSFASGKDAVRKFLHEMKSKTRDYDSVTERSMETYLQKLKIYCSDNNINNPLSPENIKVIK